MTSVLPDVISRRWKSLLAVAVIAALATAAFVMIPQYRHYHHGCGRAKDAGEIVVATGEDLVPGRRRQELIKAWNDVHPNGPSARLVEIPGGTEQQRAEMLVAQQSGSCEYDVLSLDVIWIPAFVEAGHLEAFTGGEFDPADFLRLPWQAGTGPDGKQYAIPFHSDVGLLYYRKDLEPKAPRTWDEIREKSTRSLAGLKGPAPAGFVSHLADYEGLTVAGMEAIWGAGGTLDVGTDGRVTIDAIAGAALQRLVDDVNSPLVRSDSVSAQETEPVRAFAAGSALFMRNWPFAYPVLAADSFLKGKIGVAEMPGSATHAAALGGQGLAVSANSLDKPAARELIAFLTSVEQQRHLFACGGYVPVRVEVYDDVEPCSAQPGERPPSPAENPDPLDRAALRAFAVTLRTALDQARIRPVVPDYPSFSRAFHTYLHQAMINRTPVDTAALAARLSCAAAQGGRKQTDKSVC